MTIGAMRTAFSDPTKVYLECEVCVSQIFSDPAYSRPLNASMVKRLSREWDREKLGVVYLSLREDGTFANLDGAHRVEACRNAEGQAAVVPARVYIDLTIEQEAQLWDAFNRNRRPPTQLEKFRARLAAGEQQALAIRRVAQSLGMDIMISSARQKNAGELVAVAALDDTYSLLGPAGLTSVLDILKDAFPDDPRGFQAMTIKGLAIFWHRYGNIARRTRTLDVLRRIGASQMHSKVNALRAIYTGMPPESAWGRVLHNLYNKGLHTAQLPEWYEKPGPRPRKTME